MTKNKNNERSKKLRLLSIKQPISSVIDLSIFKRLRNHIVTTEVFSGKTPAAETIERGCALIFLLIAEGGATIKSPIKKIEHLKINREDATNGFIRWTEIAGLNNKSEVFGARQFLYAYSQIHLIAFIKFRMGKINQIEKNSATIERSKKASLLPQIDKQLFSEAKTELKWLTNLKGSPNWTSIFRAYINYLLTQIVPRFDPAIRISIPALCDLAMIFLYENEEPILLETRRGEITYAPMPVKQFTKFTGIVKQRKLLSVKEQIEFENAEEYCEVGIQSNSTNFQSVKSANITFRDLAVKELRKFLTFVMDTRMPYPEAAAYGELLLNYELFSVNNSPDAHYLLKWLIKKFKEGKQNNKTGTISTYAQQLFYLSDAFRSQSFLDLTTDDLILFLSQYSTVAAAKNYLSTFRTFYDYLKSEHNASLQVIDWNNPGLKFSKDFREVELITETQFQHLLSHSSASTLLPPEQMQLVLLLMRRAGLRCSEISFLRVIDFTSFGQLKLSINFSKSIAGKRDLPLYLLLSENELNLFLNYYKPKCLQCLDDPMQLLSPFIHNQTFLTPQQIGTQVARVIEAAGLLSQTAHKLRHGFASALLAAWWIRHLQQRQKNIRANTWAQNALLEFCRPDIEGRAITYLDDIRSLMGHSSLDVTFDRYIHNLDLITADAVNLNYFLGAPKKINVSVAANLGGVSDREIRRVFSPDMRKRAQIDKRYSEIETILFKDWLTGRL